MNARAMAISHICQQCGFDLAVTRPIHDPYYGLPVVICPQCSNAAVRMKHPLQRIWKQIIRIDTIATTLVVHLHLLATSALLAIAYGFGMPPLFASIQAGNVDPRELAAPGLLTIVFLIALGAWLTAGFSHIARWRVFVGWTLTAIAAMTIVLLFALLIQLDMPRPGDLALPRDADLTFRLYIAGFIWSVSTLIIAAIALLATAGIPFGIALRSGAAAFRRWRWRQRIKRRRSARFS